MEVKKVNLYAGYDIGILRTLSYVDKTSELS